jgi:DNA-binding transcriptional LysR family regulator
MAVPAARGARFLGGLGVLNIPRADPELERLPVAMQRIELAVPIGHALTKLKKLRLRDLTDASFVLFPRRASPTLYDRLMRECLRGGLKSPCDWLGRRMGPWNGTLAVS